MQGPRLACILVCKFFSPGKRGLTSGEENFDGQTDTLRKKMSVETVLLDFRLPGCTDTSICAR